MQLLIKNKSGNTVQMDVEDLVSVDGKPYCGTRADLQPLLSAMQARIEAMENTVNAIVASAFTPQETETS